MKRRLSDGSVVDFSQPEVDEHNSLVITLAIEAKVALKQRIKDEANRRITAEFPEWKQRNMMAEMLDLFDKEKGNWNQTDIDRVAELQGIWSWIKDVRAQSDSIESEVNGLTEEQVHSFDVSGHSTWGAPYSS